MAQANVSNGVLGIIASFSNGLDVLRKLRKSHTKSSKWSRSRKQNDENALRLSRSLRRGADEIGREYQARSMRCDSERYAIGDATAQKSIAEILIKFNTGLVSIITSFLSQGDKQNRVEAVDYKSLIDLSEHSREQSISVLRQLYQRITTSPPRRAIPSNRANQTSRNLKSKSKKKTSQPNTSKQTTKSRHPTLARIVIENSNIPSQIALVRPSESSRDRDKKPRSQSHSHLRETTTPQSNLSLSSSTSQTTPPPPPPYFPSDPLPLQTTQETPTLSSSTKPPRHNPSTPSLIKHPKLRSKISTPLPQPPTTHVQPQPLQPQPSQPQPSPPPPSANTAQTPFPHRPLTLHSTTSARTGSTKLGEIPMRKWAEPWDFEAAEEANRRALEGGWPLVGVGVVGSGGAESGVGGKKRGAWRRLFGRGEGG